MTCSFCTMCLNDITKNASKDFSVHKKIACQKMGVYYNGGRGYF